jgi:hypothetical protein
MSDIEAGTQVGVRQDGGVLNHATAINLTTLLNI